MSAERVTLTDEERDLAFTDEEWADYQRLPEQGISHRRWLESVFRPKAAARDKALREEIAGEIERKAQHLNAAEDYGRGGRDGLNAAARIARGAR